MNKMCYQKIFFYELRRMLLNKRFLGLLLINGLSAWLLLSFTIIEGIAYTAPFSVWSYCAYLGQTLPLAMATILLLLSNYYGRKQKQVEVLTFATPITPFSQVMIRTLAAGICFVLIYLVVIALALIFYASLFRFHDFTAFILPSFLLLLPCFALLTGLGQLLGSLHRSLTYVLILVAFAASGIQNVFDVFGAGYFSDYPLKLPVGADGEPAFQMGSSFIVIRLLYLVLGIACIYLTTIVLSRKSRKA